MPSITRPGRAAMSTCAALIGSPALSPSTLNVGGSLWLSRKMRFPAVVIDVTPSSRSTSFDQAAFGLAAAAIGAVQAATSFWTPLILRATAKGESEEVATIGISSGLNGTAADTPAPSTGTGGDLKSQA